MKFINAKIVTMKDNIQELLPSPATNLYLSAPALKITTESDTYPDFSQVALNN